MRYRPPVLTVAALLGIGATAPPSLPAQAESELYRQAQSQVATGETVETERQSRIQEGPSSEGSEASRGSWTSGKFENVA
jgi:hypothetical protein